MATTSNYLALDLGAESGRGLLGRFDGERLDAGGGPPLPQRAGPDARHAPLGPAPALRGDQDGAAQGGRRRTAGSTASASTPGASISAWSAGARRCWATRSTIATPGPTGCSKRPFERVPRERIYEITGLQFLPFNTLYQLLAMARSNSPLLEVAETLLMMPDLFGWLLTGRRAGERTDASTTQLLDPRTRRPGPTSCAAAWACPARSSPS